MARRRFTALVALLAATRIAGGMVLGEWKLLGRSQNWVAIEASTMEDEILDTGSALKKALS